MVAEREWQFGGYMGTASSLVLWIWDLLAVRYDFKLHDGKNKFPSSVR